MIDWHKENIEKNLSTLSQMNKAGTFENFIHYIDFATFKNFEKSSRVNFLHPITVLVGKNGLGKSSCLHALYGAPLGSSISTFWFSTAVDPIEEVDDGDRHRYYYAYGPEKLEVLYTRINVAEKPDYWETSRPYESLGMKKHTRKGSTRNKPVKKDVVYIDFRSELSPYDQYYYFSSLQKTKRIKTKQDYIREKSKFLQEVIQTNGYIKKWKKFIGHPPKELDSEELEAVKFILAKEYKRAISIEHSFFTEDFRESIIFFNDSLNYTEAHAGSGEISVVNIVRKIFAARSNSLVLLDEPEVSLHPEAQKRLMIFLSKISIQKKLQVVISTHSTDIIELFNQESIKLLFQPEGSTKVRIVENVSPHATFGNLGRTLPSITPIYVEDIVAKTILEQVIRLSEDTGIRSLEKRLDIQFYPGGETYLKTIFIPLVKKTHRSGIIFDGDQDKKFDYKTLKCSSNKSDKNRELKEFLKMISGIDYKSISFPLNSTGSSDLDLVNSQIENYIDYFQSNVDYFPEQIPEDILWDKQFVSYFVNKVNGKDFEDFDRNFKDSKAKLYQLCLAYEKKSKVSDNEYMKMLEIIIREWIESNDKNYKCIISILRKYV